MLILAHSLEPFMIVGWAGALFLGLPAILMLLVSARWARRMGMLALVAGGLQMLSFLMLNFTSSYSFASALSPDRVIGTLGMSAIFWAPPVVLGGIAFAAGQSMLKRAKHVDSTRCAKCGYMLRGLVEPRCPECGQPFAESLLNAVGGGGVPTDVAPPEIPESVHPRRRLIRIAVVVGIVVLLGIYLTNKYLNRQIPFDPVRWQTISKKERSRMLDDIANAGNLISRTHAEVIKVLGPPDAEAIAYKVGTGHNRFEIELNYDTGKLAFGGGVLDRPPPAVPFDQERWRTLGPEERWPMAVSLQTKSELLAGKSHDEIIEMLGSPDDRESMRYSCRHLNDALIVELQNGWVSEVYHFDMSR